MVVGHFHDLTGTSLGQSVRCTPGGRLKNTPHESTDRPCGGYGREACDISYLRFLGFFRYFPVTLSALGELLADFLRHARLARKAGECAIASMKLCCFRLLDGI